MDGTARDRDSDIAAARELRAEETGSLYDAVAPDVAADELFEAVANELRSNPPRLPGATYRFQFNKHFTFADARRLVPYLRALGVTDLYASPYFRASPESLHGYDIVDHNAINPAIGTREELEALAADLRAAGMGQVLDFVPNHMGIGAGQNPWWSDVLENGPSSLYAPFFDIDWEPLKSELREKVLLPVLGDHYGRVLENGELQLRFDAGGFGLHYYATAFPINPRTYPEILEPEVRPLVAKLGDEHDAVVELQSILTGLRNLPPRSETNRQKKIERRREKEVLKRRLATLVAESPDVAAAVDSALARMNGTKGDPRSFDALDRLLEEQAYRLSFWRVAAEEINYRRFFDINELAAIHMENPAVFAQAHRTVFELLARGVVTGLRIDHPDGLWDPRGYFTAVQRGHFLELCRKHLAARRGAAPDDPAIATAMAHLRTRLVALFERAVIEDPHSPVARPVYLVVEKILSRGETLPADWPVHGTVGYEFATSVGGLFVDASSEHALTETYARFTGTRLDFESLVYEKKKLILNTSLASELNVLASRLNRLSERDRHTRDFTLGLLTHALREVIACFPVYRTYVTEDTDALDEHDRAAVVRAIRRARVRNPSTDASVFAFLRAVLTLEAGPDLRADDLAARRDFVMRVQQLTGPVMAKGLEDTSFYIYNRLVALNEVGGEPETFGTALATFHRANAARQRVSPHAMLATSTHDTKRSEDARARVCVLSELPEAWAETLAACARATAPFKSDVDGRPAPDANEEYLFYQSVLATLPFARPRGEALAAYANRLVEYMRKATKEAKVHTSWINADPEYDAAVEQYVRGALAEDSPLWDALGPLAARVAYHGAWNALAQCLLKFTSPGVPDLYQGNETWDFSLVDPDNRRPVDFDARARMLDEVCAGADRGAAFARELAASPEDGRIKMFVTAIALAARASRPEAFGAEGAYVPVDVDGALADHVVAFARRGGGAEFVVVAPRLTARLAGDALAPPTGERWGDASVVVPEGRYRNLFTGALEEARERDGRASLDVARLLADFPVALLAREDASGSDPG